MPTVIDGRSETVWLPAGRALSVVSVTGAGRVTYLSQSGFAAIGAGLTVTFGPYADVRGFRLEALDGDLTYTDAGVDFPTAAESLAAALAALPDVALPVVGTVGDLREYVGEGVPDATAHSALTVNPTGDDNGLIFTAVAYGAGGDDISVRYVDPAANDAELSVAVVGSAITVNLATDSGGTITSTAADVLAAIEASPAADALVTVAIMTADSGTADDGTGVVTARSLANLAGGTGVGIGVAGKGSRYTDITNGTLYLNTGTKAVPVWTQLAPVA